MLPAKIREKKIDEIEDILRDMKSLASEWQKEAEAPDAKSFEKFPYTCIRFMARLTQAWAATERELLGAETVIRKLKKSNKRSQRRK
jgi:hypothetical protein